MSSANRSSFIFSFLICMHFISFSCLLCWLGSQYNDGLDILALLGILGGKAFSLSPLSVLLVVGFKNVYQDEDVLYSSFFSGGLCDTQCWNCLIIFLQKLIQSCSFFLFSLLIWWITLIDL